MFMKNSILPEVARGPALFDGESKTNQSPFLFLAMDSRKLISMCPLVVSDDPSLSPNPSQPTQQQDRGVYFPARQCNKRLLVSSRSHTSSMRVPLGPAPTGGGCDDRGGGSIGRRRRQQQREEEELGQQQLTMPPTHQQTQTRQLFPPQVQQHRHQQQQHQPPHQPTHSVASSSSSSSTTTTATSTLPVVVHPPTAPTLRRPGGGGAGAASLAVAVPVTTTTPAVLVVGQVEAAPVLPTAAVMARPAPVLVATTATRPSSSAHDDTGACSAGSYYHHHGRDEEEDDEEQEREELVVLVEGHPLLYPSQTSRSSNKVQEDKVQPMGGRVVGGVAVLLVMLTLLNTVNFWDRNLLFNLAATDTPGCDQVCANAVAVPTCLECHDAIMGAGFWGGRGPPSDMWDEEDQCDRCRLCRIHYQSEYYNMRDGACLSSGQYALLSGFGFTLSFALVGVLAGYLADRYDRRLVHTAAILMWSVATVGSGMASSFLPLLACRVLLGVAQAFNAPCCYALITAHFTEAPRRSLANGIYSMGTYLGAGLSSLSIILALRVGWRNASYLAGTAGMGLALLYSLLVVSTQSSTTTTSASLRPRAAAPPPPDKQVKDCDGRQKRKRKGMGEEAGLLLAIEEEAGVGGGGGDDGEEGEEEGEGRCLEAGEAVAEVLSSYSMLLLCLASSLRMVGTTTFAAFLPVLYQRTFLTHVRHFSLINAIGYSLCGSLSSFFGGLVAGRAMEGSSNSSRTMRRSSSSGAPLAFLPAVGLACAVLPLAVLLLWPSSFRVSMVALLVHYLLAECWLGPGMAILQLQLRPEVHGVGVAVLLLCNNLLCTLGPAAVGMVDDGSASSLKAIFFVVMLSSYLGSALVFAILGLHLHHHHSRRRRHATGTKDPRGGRRNGGNSSSMSSRSQCSGSGGDPAWGWRSSRRKEHMGTGGGGGKGQEETAPLLFEPHQLEK